MHNGIPDTCISDNGPQFSSEEFANFAKTWEFQHLTSSPHHPRSNGKAEQSVKTIKQILKKAKHSKSDPFLALLDFRNTPTQHIGTSPVQRLMNRRTKTLLPTKGDLLKTNNSDMEKQKITKMKSRMSENYNKTAHPLPPLNPGDVVRVKTPNRNWEKGVVTSEVDSRSYEVETESGGNYRRNR